MCTSIISGMLTPCILFGKDGKGQYDPIQNIALILRQNDIYHYWLGNITGNIAGFMPWGSCFH